MNVGHPPLPLPEVTGELPDETILSRSADTFAMLAAVPRLRLLWLLSQGELDVSALAHATEASSQAVSQHLTKLRLAGLVESRRDGRRHVYSVTDPHVVSLVAQVIDHHEDLRRRRTD